MKNIYINLIFEWLSNYIISYEYFNTFFAIYSWVIFIYIILNKEWDNNKTNNNNKTKTNTKTKTKTNKSYLLNSSASSAIGGLMDNSTGC